MKTTYYCKACDEHFEDSAVPNINKTHRCGTVARIVEHVAYGKEK